MSPRAKGQPVTPKAVMFCLECISAGTHRAGCVMQKPQAKPKRIKATKPLPTDNDPVE